MFHVYFSYIIPTFRNKIGHLATKLPPNEVGILKFRASYVCAKDRENIGISVSRMSFEACERSSLHDSVPLEGFGITGALLLKMLYLIDI